MQDAQDIRSSHAATNLTRLMAMLEEVDTGLIRHAIDVHFGHSCAYSAGFQIWHANFDNLWIMAGKQQSEGIC